MQSTPLPLQPEWVSDIRWPLVGTTLGALLVVGGIAALWMYYLRRRAAAARLAAITGGAYAWLHNVVVPDSQGLPLHVDYLLLTARGVVIIDLREVRGNIFGGDQMAEWTVMDRNLRTTFVNPQPAMLDRIAALRALVDDLPIDGQIVFTARSHFPKGLPSNTRLLESFTDEYQALNPAKAGPLAEGWLTEWRAIEAASKPSRLAKPVAAV